MLKRKSRLSLTIYTYSFMLVSQTKLLLDSFFKRILAFNFCRFCVVIRVFSSPPQRPMTSDFKGFSIPDFIHYIYFPILILEKEPVFSLLNVQCSTWLSIRSQEVNETIWWRQKEHENILWCQGKNETLVPFL